jgi:hypothetical protein
MAETEDAVTVAVAQGCTAVSKKELGNAIVLVI